MQSRLASNGATPLQPEAQAVTALDKAATPARLRSIFVASAMSNFDRFVVGPMLVAIAATFAVNLSEASLVATAYFVAYGLSQPVWGIVSDRRGRVPTIRIALLIGAAADVASAFAPNLGVLVCSRAVAGVAFGAIVPAAITHIGDNTAVDRRQRTLSDMLAAMAVGSTLATFVAGFATDAYGWRPIFALIGVASTLLWLQLERSASAVPIQETKKNAGYASIRRVLHSGWAVLVLILATLEGGLVLGLFALLPSAIEQHHKSAAFAGAVVAVYGVSVLMTTPLTKRLSSRPIVPICLGGTSLVLACVAPLIIGGIYPLVICASLLGVTWSAFHSSIQAWMTMTVPSERATCVALMTSGLFFGSGIGSAVGARLIDHHQSSWLFAMWTIAGCLLTAGAVAGRRRFEHRIAVPSVPGPRRG